MSEVTIIEQMEMNLYYHQQEIKKKNLNKVRLI